MISGHRALFCAACILLVHLSLQSALAANPQDKYKEMQEKIKEHKEKLTATEKQENSLLTEIQDMNEKLEKTERELENYKRDLKNTELKIVRAIEDISETEKALEKQKMWLRLRLKSTYKYRHSGNSLIMLLNAQDLSQMMRVMRYAEAISLYEDNLLNNFRQNHERLEKHNNSLQSLRGELLALSKNVKVKQEELNDQKNRKNLLLASTRQKKTEYHRMIAELEEASKKLLEVIRESEKTGDYGATGFQKLKGRLLWPASGDIAVPYGTQKDTQFDTPVFRNGIHIRTDAGVSVKSVHEGKVIFAEWFKGFGKLIILNHGGGYHTLYGNLSEIFSRVGDIISENQAIGKVGTSTVLNSPGVYFEIRYKGKPLNPVQWLKK